MYKQKTNPKELALIYCRTSFYLRDVYDALLDQEIRCRAQALTQGYQVVRLFYDKCDTGVLHPPSLASAIEYIQDQDSAQFVVICDKVERLACSSERLDELMRQLGVHGARLEFAEPDIEREAGSLGVRMIDLCDASRMTLHSFRETSLQGTGGAP